MTEHRLRRWALAAIAALGLSLSGLALSGCQNGDSNNPQVINFSILSTENSQNLEKEWAPFLSDMRKQTGLNIKPYFASDYTALIEAMRFKQVQLGWFSNLSGLEAVRRGGGEVFAHSTDPTPGVSGYNSVIIVNANSGITLDRLLTCDRSLSFGLGDARSTSGTLAPMTYLFGPRNIDPQTCFRTVRSANHQANLFSVANGVVDAATNNSTAITMLKASRPDIAAKVKVIWTSPRLPEDPVVWRKDLDPQIKEKLRSFFLSYGSAPGAEGERQRKILASLHFGRFQPADDSFLLPVREMEATEKLIAARNAHKDTDVKAAQAELADIQQEKVAAGAQPTAAPAVDSVPAPASK
ncbi:MAG TPA: phosphate/phosphite/phosphonate ABC transporter substrate-binding protein [Caulobacteraceae bacterium]|nr:phosphate/phosphite/phosphonate ABC transporter substrate-binding protein [Caulobacteraceae bacterium]